MQRDRGAVRGSEDQLQAELQIPRRIGAGNAAECGGAQHAARLPKPWGVGEVKRFEPELQSDLLPNLKVLQRREIPVEEAALTQSVPSRIADLVLPVGRESVRVEVALHRSSPRAGVAD